MDLTPEELLAKLQEAEGKLQESENRLQALERTKGGLLADLTRRKGVERLAKAAGIDLSSDDAEDRIATLLAAAAPKGDDEADPVEPARPGDSATGRSAPGGGDSEVLKAQIASMQTQMEKLNKKLEATEKEKQAERKARLEEFKRSVVLQELEKAGCKRPAHVYRLQGDHFRLLEDGETVVYGTEENPIPVSDAVSNLEKDDEYSIYFPGIVASGSGLPTSRSSMPVNENPFMKSAANATKAAEIIQRDKAYARRLVQQARARGDVDPVLARAVDY